MAPEAGGAGAAGQPGGAGVVAEAGGAAGAGEAGTAGETAGGQWFPHIYLVVEGRARAVLDLVGSAPRVRVVAARGEGDDEIASLAGRLTGRRGGGTARPEAAARRRRGGGGRPRPGRAVPP